MNHTKITVAHVYLTEGDKLLHTFMEYLHNDMHVRGVTVLRGIEGFGKSGVMHSSKLLSMSLDLPLVIEFFDTPEKVMTALEYLAPQLGAGHIISWEATATDGLAANVNSSSA